MWHVTVLLLAISLASSPAVFAGAEDPPAFVLERGRRSQAEFTDGVLRLRAGRGWVRSRRVLNDFVMTLEFRVADNRSDVGIGIRTLTGDDGWPRAGYRLTLAEPDVSGQIVARRVPVTVIQAHRVPPPSAGEWHQLMVEAKGTRITVTVDRIVTSIAEIAHLQGSVLFDVRRGAAEFRNITLRQLPFRSRAFRMKEPGLEGRLEPPRIVREIKPVYPVSAMRRGIQGVVTVEAIVLEDGSVGPVEIATFLHPELEHAAVAAISRWRFSPGTLDGKPVPVRVEIELTFTTR